MVHAGANTLADFDCNEPEVEAKLKPDKAAGSDDFLPKVLNAVADGVFPHLCQIYNGSSTSKGATHQKRSPYLMKIY